MENELAEFTVKIKLRKNLTPKGVSELQKVITDNEESLKDALTSACNDLIIRHFLESFIVAEVNRK